MTARLLGAHMPISKGLDHAAREAFRMGCTTMQVFTKSPQVWKSKPVTDESAQKYRQAIAETGLKDVVCHDSYLINLCAATDELREKSINGLIDEMGRCSQYGIQYVNSHMGAHVGQGEAIGIQKVVEATRQVLGETDPSVTLLMETTAGQGSCLGATFEQLAEILEGLGGDPRIGICVDTCHIFSAGYDLRDEQTFQETFSRFEVVLGLDRLKAIHCNDSLTPLGGKKDRHAPIAEGEIGEGAFRILVNDPRFTQIPIILETPMEDDGHAKDLAKLKSYIED